MLVFIHYTIVVACLSAFIVLFLNKIGFVNTMQVHAPKLISELFSCQFCLSFWVAVLISITVSIVLTNPIFLLIPVFSTVITRRLL